jgi:hypothetical protein
MLPDDCQNILNHYSQDERFFIKSGSNLKALRLGDFVTFNRSNNVILDTVEFKTVNYKYLDTNYKINAAFESNFKKNQLLDKQLLNAYNNMLYLKKINQNDFTSCDLSKLKLNDKFLNEAFKGRQYALKPVNVTPLYQNLCHTVIRKIPLLKC